MDISYYLWYNLEIVPENRNIFSSARQIHVKIKTQNEVNESRKTHTKINQNDRVRCHLGRQLQRLAL